MTVRHRGRPGRVVAFVAVAAVALGGCSVRGTIDVTDAGAEVDLAVRYDTSGPEGAGEGPCTTGWFFGPPPSEVEFDGTTVSCRLVGTVRDEGALAHGGGHYTLFIPALDNLSESGRLPSGVDVDVTVTFPGRVVAASHGSVRGNTVHATDPSVPYAILARDAPDIDPALVAALGALAGGAVLGVGGAWVVGRRRRGGGLDTLVPRSSTSGEGPRNSTSGEGGLDTPLVPRNSTGDDDAQWAPDAQDSP